MDTPTVKTKILAFQEKYRIHSQICIYKKLTEQVNSFICLCMKMRNTSTLLEKKI
jgi:hypothetical protein